jgi:riboflavin synthase
VFTGLIADLGRVSALDQSDAGATLRIHTRLASELGEGDSIAVNGVCLTVSTLAEQEFEAEAMIETLSRSALGALRTGDRVNLELPLRASDRLGGHVVQGHVDGIGTVSAIRSEGFARVLEIETEPPLLRYLVEKGSVALDGVSLTVSALGENGFTVSLIPETLKRTNLGSLEQEALLNIEVDVLAKHLERLVAAYPQGSTIVGGRA